MHHLKLAGLIAVAITAGILRVATAGDGHCACQSCQAPDGCCYHDVVRHRCVMVPDKKQIKKTVYECRDVPYCEHRLPKFGHCDCCPDCMACPKYKKVLVKREIVVSEICITKCVVEEYTERVLGPCCRCGHSSGDGKGYENVNPEVPVPPTPPADTKSAWLPPEPIEDAPSKR
jgi:hypothetical protein